MSSKTGRPSKYRSHVLPRLDEIVEWYSKGAIDSEAARLLGVSLSTFRSYKGKHKEFKEALELGNRIVSDEVEAALYKRAMGYIYIEVRTVLERDSEGNERLISRMETLKHVPGDVGAQAFWLKNKRPEVWKDRHDLDLSSLPPIRLFDVDVLP